MIESTIKLFIGFEIDTWKMNTFWVFGKELSKKDIILTVDCKDMFDSKFVKKAFLLIFHVLVTLVNSF